MGPDDLEHEMPRSPLDDATADRLLAGGLDPEDAPPGYGVVAALVAAARGLPAAADPIDRAAAVSAITATIARTPGNSLSPQREGGRRMTSKLLTLKALGIALPVLALTAGTAAAATGSLPSPAQSAVSTALSTVGIHVPSGNNGSAAPAHAVGPDATGSARFGLCTAARANGGHASARSVAFSNLEKAAAAANQTVTQFCAVVTPPSGDNGTSSRMDNNGSSTPVSNPTRPPPFAPARGARPVSNPTGPPQFAPERGANSTGPPPFAPERGANSTGRSPFAPPGKP